MHYVSIKIGLYMLAALIAYFLLMYALGLGYRTEFRFFNSVIQILFVYRAIRAYYALSPKSTHNNLLGVAQGMWVSLIGVGGFAVFITIFMYLNPTLMTAIAQNSVLKNSLNPFTVSLYIVAEGLIVSLIGSYIFTRVSEDVPITKEDKIS
jgi:hypothetical protein